MFQIDSAKCNGCGACVEFCPQGAISLRGEKAVINQWRCIECGTCLNVCPVGAVYEVAPVRQASGTYKRSAIDREGKEVSGMRGRGWFGWGGWGGFGRGRGRGWFGPGWGWGGPGWGRGNPYPFCRFYPWLPRWWWATPYAGHYAATTPYMGYGYPYYGTAGVPYGVGAPGVPYGMGPY